METVIVEVWNPDTEFFILLFSNFQPISELLVYYDYSCPTSNYQYIDCIIDIIRYYCIEIYSEIIVCCRK